MRVTHEIGGVARLLEGVARSGAQHGVNPVVRGSVGVGVVHVALPADVEPEAARAFITTLREDAPAWNGQVVVLAGARSVKQRVDVGDRQEDGTDASDQGQIRPGAAPVAGSFRRRDLDGSISSRLSGRGRKQSRRVLMNDAGQGPAPVSSTTGTKGSDGPQYLAPPPPGEPAFDDHHPPSAELVADCVHCGFCLPTCPTYALWGEEMDSPRGRIYLMNTGLQGEPITPSMVQHFDACLGCMACVTACPSGVQYDKLIEATRAQVERRYDRSTSDRALRSAIFAVFPYPRRLRLFRGPLRAYQASGLQRLLRRSGLLSRVPPALAAMESLAPPLGRADRIPAYTPAVGPRRGSVGVLLGCVQRTFFPGVNAATVRVLAAEGFDVHAPSRQGCCGALSMHNGRESEAADFARALIDSLEDADVNHVVVNAAGCGSTMKEYAAVLAEDPDYAQRAARFQRQGP